MYGLQNSRIRVASVIRMKLQGRYYLEEEWNRGIFVSYHLRMVRGVFIFGRNRNEICHAGSQGDVFERKTPKTWQKNAFREIFVDKRVLYCINKERDPEM